MDVTVVDRPAQLAALVERLASASRLAADGEGDSFHRYRGKFCTLQLAATPEHCAVVDPLALEDLSPVQALLDSAVMIFHDVSFDAKMMASRGLVLGEVFDTAATARFLGEPSTGLAALLAKYLDVHVEKRFQKADWAERPIAADKLEYLGSDVGHLFDLADLLAERAREADIVEEIDVEVRYAMDRAVEPETVREAWTRIKGARDLGPGQLALVKALADQRELEAERRDVPPFRVAPNEAFIEAVRRRVRGIGDLKRVRGLRQLGSERLAAALEAAEHDGPPDTSPEPGPPPEERQARKDREQALTRWRKAEAKRRTVDPQVVLPGHCLRDLARGIPMDEVAGFGEKRLRLYRDVLQPMLSD